MIQRRRTYKYRTTPDEDGSQYILGSLFSQPSEYLYIVIMLSQRALAVALHFVALFSFVVADHTCKCLFMLKDAIIRANFLHVSQSSSRTIVEIM